MATRRKDITTLFSSNNANVFWEPASVKFTTAPWEQPILIFTDTATRDGVFAAFAIPADYVGSAAFVVAWTSDTATSGDVEFDVDYRNVAVTESVDQASQQEALNSNDTAPGTAALLKEITVGTATGSNFTADDLCQIALYRDGTDGGDTMSDVAAVFKIFFEYADA